MAGEAKSACDAGRKKLCGHLAGTYESYKKNFDNTRTQLNTLRTSMAQESQLLVNDGCGRYELPSRYTPKY